MVDGYKSEEVYRREQAAKAVEAERVLRQNVVRRREAFIALCERLRAACASRAPDCMIEERRHKRDGTPRANSVIGPAWLFGSHTIQWDIADSTTTHYALSRTGKVYAGQYFSERKALVVGRERTFDDREIGEITSMIECFLAEHQSQPKG